MCTCAGASSRSMPRPARASGRPTRSRPATTAARCGARPRSTRGSAGCTRGPINNDSNDGGATADGGPVHFGSVSAANGVVYTTDLAGFLDAHEATTGAPLAKLPLGRPSWGGVSIAGGSVFATTGTETDTGYVVAYRPRG